ncbi:MAG: hypothetical protein R3F59_05540 [Myxococcota bacterium]
MTLRTLVLAALLAPTPALAVPQCPTVEQRAELSDFARELQGADSPAEARKMALKKVRASHRAVDQAMKLVPGDAELRERQVDLESFEAGVRASKSQAEVASHFSALEARAAAGSCHYSTGEVIAVVLGFVLGIIPGIILLILLC